MTSKAYFSFDAQQIAFKVLSALEPCALESLIFAQQLRYFSLEALKLCVVFVVVLHILFQM